MLVSSHDLINNLISCLVTALQAHSEHHEYYLVTCMKNIYNPCHKPLIQYWYWYVRKVG